MSCTAMFLNKLFRSLDQEASHNSHFTGQFQLNCKEPKVIKIFLFIVVSIIMVYPMVSAELVPGTSMEYTTLPGYGYAGDSHVLDENFLTYLDQ